MTDHKSKQVQGISSDTTNLARKTQERVHLLNKEAAEMTQVIAVLTEISEQTNILAINLLLEASRNSESRCRFTVALNEITQLSGQTAIATTEIKERVRTICNTAKESTEDISAITEVICRLQKNIRQKAPSKRKNKNCDKL